MRKEEPAKSALIKDFLHRVQRSQTTAKVKQIWKAKSRCLCSACAWRSVITLADVARTLQTAVSSYLSLVHVGVLRWCRVRIN